MLNWIKNNKLSSLLFVVVFYFIYQFYLGASGRTVNQYMYSSDNFAALESASGAPATSKIALPVAGGSREYPPQPDVSERLVIQESNLSLLVKNVVDVRNKILEHTTSNGGYMVTSSTSNPEDAPTGNISIRIPADKLQDTLDYFHSLSVKVVSENLYGRDVTDQYVDIETHIKLLEATKAKYENILDQATRVSDITEITNQILYVQSQIDSYIGQQESLKKNAELAKLTVYLSTDEIALPYAPSETFRPQVIFKLAVRSLVSTLRDIGEFAIWAGVYAAIWVPLLLIYVFGRKWWLKKQNAK